MGTSTYYGTAALNKEHSVALFQRMVRILMALTGWIGGIPFRLSKAGVS
jgi:hypothetical protein